MLWILKCMDVGRISSSGEGSNSRFFQGKPKIFFQGGSTMVNFNFTHLKLREQPSLLKM